MLEEFKKNLQIIFETSEYDTTIREEDNAPSNDFIHTASSGQSYKVQVDPNNQQFTVFDKSNNPIDIFLPSMVNQNGGIPKEMRKEIADDYNQNHSQPEDLAEGAPKTKEAHGGNYDHVRNMHKQSDVKSKGAKNVHRQAAKKDIEDQLSDPLDEAVNKGKESHGGTNHDVGYYTKDEMKSKSAHTVQRQAAKKDIVDQLAEPLDEPLEEENKINNFPLAEEKEKWIAGAVHHPGRFTEYCKKNGFEGPCEECAAHAMKSDDASVRGMAEFYRNVKK